MGFELTLEEIARITGGSLHGNRSRLIRTLAIDSRTLVPSMHTLFIALRGERHDGHDYIGELYERGIVAFLVSGSVNTPSYPDAGFCLVDDTLTALQAIAAERRNRFGGVVAAITGSNGKTIVKEWIYQCLRDRYRVFRSPKSYNSQVGVPLSVWMMGEEDTLSVIEAGISEPGEMERLRAIIQPQVGLLTNLGTAHQENFHSLEQKLEEKLKLFEGCERIICRIDGDPAGISPFTALKDPAADIRGWSLGGEALYTYTIREQGEGRTSLHGRAPAGEFLFDLPFTDDASLENALHVLTFCLEMGLEPGRASEAVAGVEPVSMRLEMLQGVMGSTLINDAYNADI
ncbi:MAG: bifunctional UDP-N-acetylmuramoyl-tripeptide:D-alanyl-D-alanine ligase/alanine racemase, partial [Bacteroidetes bacterium]